MRRDPRGHPRSSRRAAPLVSRGRLHMVALPLAARRGPAPCGHWRAGARDWRVRTGLRGLVFVAAFNHASRLRPRCLDGANPSAPAGLAPEQAPDPAAATTT